MRIFTSRLLSEAAVNSGIVMLMTVGIFAVVKLLALLRRVVQGHLPADGLGMIFTYKLATFLDVILMPAVFLAILFMLMRWNRDNEITIFATSGVGPLNYLKPAITVAAIATLVVAILSLYVTPAAELGYHHELEKFRLTQKSTPFEKGQFRQFDTGHNVIHYSSRAEDVTDPLRLFYLRTTAPGVSIVVAKEGSYEFDLINGVETVQVKNGTQYWLENDPLELQITEFATFTDRTPVETFSDTTINVKAKSTRQLIGSDNPADQAELHWRVTKILAVTLVVLLAFVWGTVVSRTYMNASFVGAVFVYFLYNSLLSFVADLLRDGKLHPGWLSELPHLVLMLLIVGIVWRAYSNRSFHAIMANRKVRTSGMT